MLPFCLNCGNEKIESCFFCIRCGTELADVAPLQILTPGILLDRRYKIQYLLRESEGGIIYKAEDIRFRTLCIVKELLLNYGDDQDFNNYLRNIREEIKLFCNIRHPCIPAITNYFMQNGRHYLVMDYFEGKSLKTILEEKGNPGLREEQVISWTMQILDVLEYVHNYEPSIIYRDINPDNIMMKDNDKRLVFLDFYISSSDPDAKRKGILPAGDYSAPEEKKGEYSVKSDIFALGATIYHLLTGKVENFSGGKFNPVKEVLTPFKLVSIVEKSLSLNPEERYKSVQDIKKELFKITDTGKRDGTDHLPASSKEIDRIKPEEPVPSETPTVSPKSVESVISLPDVTVDSISKDTPVRTEIMQSAQTEQLPSSLPVEVIKEPVIKPVDNIIDIKKIDKKPGLTGKRIIVSVIVFLIAFIVFIFILINFSTSEKLFKEGVISFKKGTEKKIAYSSNSSVNYNSPITDYTQAIYSFEEYSSRKSRDFRSYYMMGHSYYGIYEIEVLKQKHERTKKSLSKEDLQKSINMFNIALTYNPEYIGSHYYLARSYYDTGEWEKAREELNKSQNLLSSVVDEVNRIKWENNIKRALKGFKIFTSKKDVTVSMCQVEIINKTGINVYIEFNGLNAELISILPDETGYKDLFPGEYKFRIIIDDKLLFSDKVNFEKHRVYTLTCKNLENTFTVFDINDFYK